MHDLLPTRLINSHDAIFSMHTGEIIPVEVPRNLKAGILHVVWHVEVGKYHGNP